MRRRGAGRRIASGAGLSGRSGRRRAVQYQRVGESAAGPARDSRKGDGSPRAAAVPRGPRRPCLRRGPARSRAGGVSPGSGGLVDRDLPRELTGRRRGPPHGHRGGARQHARVGAPERAERLVPQPRGGARAIRDKVLLDEERAVDFLLRDDTGTVRVVPRGARYEVAPAFDATTNLLGEEPIGLNRRIGAASMAVADFDRDAAIADLLTVRPPSHDDGEHTDGPADRPPRPQARASPLHGVAPGARRARDAGRLRATVRRAGSAGSGGAAGVHRPDHLRRSSDRRGAGRGPRRGHAGADGPRGVGQRRHPGLRDRPAGRDADAGSRRHAGGARGARPRPRAPSASSRSRRRPW